MINYEMLNGKITTLLVRSRWRWGRKRSEVSKIFGNCCFNCHIHSKVEFDVHIVRYFLPTGASAGWRRRTASFPCTVSRLVKTCRLSAENEREQGNQHCSKSDCSCARTIADRRRANPSIPRSRSGRARISLRYELTDPSPPYTCSANNSATSAKIIIAYELAANMASCSVSYSPVRKIIAFRTIAITPV